MTFERTGPESDEPHRALIRFFFSPSVTAHV